MQKSGNGDAIQKHITEQCLRMTTAQKKLTELTCPMTEKCTRGWSKTPEVTQLIHLLAKTIGAKRVVEVGCENGTVTMALATAVPTDGHVTTIDCNDKMINQIKTVWKEGGVEGKIHVRIGEEQGQLDKLIGEGETGKVDMLVIDGDQKNALKNYEKGMKLVRTGGIIVILRVLNRGEVAKETAHDEETKTLRELHKLLKEDKRVEISCLGIADGVTICLKKE